MNKFEQFFDSILDGNTSISEADIIRKDGTKLPTEFSSTLVTISGKKFMHTTARNVSIQKKAKALLKESKNRYKLLSDATFEAIFISENGICIGQNNAASRIFGYTEAQALERMATDWIHPDDREQFKKTCYQGLKALMKLRPYAGMVQHSIAVFKAVTIPIKAGASERSACSRSETAESCIP